MMAVVFVLLPLAVGLALAQTPALDTCSVGVGLSPWLRNWDSREEAYTITCADGRDWTKRGVVDSTERLVNWNVELRPLGRGLRRQGFRLSLLNFNDPAQLVGACIGDSAPVGDSVWLGLKPGNNCRGLNWASRVGSPFFEQSLDNSIRVLRGWQVKNPPLPTTRFGPPLTGKPAAAAAAGSKLAETPAFIFPGATVLATGMVGFQGRVACNFLFPGNEMGMDRATVAGCAVPNICGLGTEKGTPMGMVTPVQQITGAVAVWPLAAVLRQPIALRPVLAEESGLANYNGLSNRFYYPCSPAWFTQQDQTNAANQITSADWVVGGAVLAPSTQKYGSFGAVVQTFQGYQLRSLANAHAPAVKQYGQNGPFPIVMYANYAISQQNSQLGFQLGCDVNDLDETKYIFFTFWTGGTSNAGVNTRYFFCYPTIQDGGDNTLGAGTNAEPGNEGNLAASTSTWVQGAALTDWVAWPQAIVPPLAVGGQPLANTFQLGCWNDHFTAAPGQIAAPAGRPSSAVYATLKVTCKNVATETPTPPLYPRGPAPSPRDAPFPITPGARGSATIIVEVCDRRCSDRTFQSGLITAIGQAAQQNNNVGANTEIQCQVSKDCTEELDTTALSGREDTTTFAGRRGLKQAPAAVTATSVSYLMVLAIVTREVGTARYLINQIRAGTLGAWINAFASIRLVYTNLQGVRQPMAVQPPSASQPIAVWPSPQASWTGSCEVYSICRTGGCTSNCNNKAIVKPTDYSGVDILCICNACATSAADPLVMTEYYFQTFGCGSLKTQAEANTCCRNVMQDAICWAVNNAEVAPFDKASIAAGKWPYRPPSIGSYIPAPRRYDGPRDCPSSSSSPKGLLGLLGLLGIIPCCLCLLSLLLCLLRRKKREGDVHFATFDPCASQCPPVATAPCAPVCY